MVFYCGEIEACHGAAATPGRAACASCYRCAEAASVRLLAVDLVRTAAGLLVCGGLRH